MHLQRIYKARQLVEQVKIEGMIDSKSNSIFSEYFNCHVSCTIFQGSLTSTLCTMHFKIDHTPLTTVLERTKA